MGGYLICLMASQTLSISNVGCIDGSHIEYIWFYKHFPDKITRMCWANPLKGQKNALTYFVTDWMTPLYDLLF
jgi:hypothetical protein